MKLAECPQDATVVAALAAGSISDELAAHVSVCPVCEDAKLVWSYLAACAAAGAEAEIAPAQTIWWRAQLAKKRGAARRSIAWIDAMQKIAVAIAALVAAGIGAWQSPKLFEIAPLILAGSSAVLLLLLASVVVVLTLSGRRTLPRGM